MDRLTQQIIANRLKRIAEELQEINEMLKPTLPKDNYMARVKEMDPEKFRQLCQGNWDNAQPPGEDTVVAKGKEPHPDSLEGYRDNMAAIRDKMAKDALSEIPKQTKKWKVKPSELDSRYPVLRANKYGDAINEINNTIWDTLSIKDYKKYQRLKGSIINTMKVRGITSVPLDHHEPDWQLKEKGQ